MCLPLPVWFCFPGCGLPVKPLLSLIKSVPAEALLQKFLRNAHLCSGDGAPDPAAGVTLNTSQTNTLLNEPRNSFLPRRGCCLALLQTPPGRTSECSLSHNASQTKLNACEHPERTGKLQKTDLHKPQHVQGFAAEQVLFRWVVVPQGHEPIQMQGAVLSTLSSCPFNMD